MNTVNLNPISFGGQFPKDQKIAIQIDSAQKKIDWCKKSANLNMSMPLNVSIFVEDAVRQMESLTKAVAMLAERQGINLIK